MSANFRLEPTVCPLCGAVDHTVLREAPDRLGVSDQQFRLVRCRACTLVYQNPRVAPDTIGVFYPETYAHYQVTTPARRRRGGAELERSLRHKCELVKRLCPTPGRLLEVGSANGDFLAGMQAAGWQVDGVEISGQAVEACRKVHGIETFHGEALDRPDNGARFDVIVLWAVLPHISRPVETTRALARLLAPGGRLIMLCANIDSIVADCMGSDWGHLDQPRHYTMWSPRTLVALYQTAGLKVEETIFHDDVYWSGLTLKFLKPICGIKATRTSPILLKAIRYAAIRLNRWLTVPVLARHRRIGRGGIVTVSGRVA